MPFVTLEPTAGRMARGRYVAMSVLRDNNNNNLALCIYFSVETLGELNWDNGVRKLSIAEGIEIDAGTFLLTPAKEGYVLSKGTVVKTRVVRPSVSKLKHYVVSDGPHYATVCTYSADKQAGVLIQVPDWLEYVGPVKAEKPFKGHIVGSKRA